MEISYIKLKEISPFVRKALNNSLSADVKKDAFFPQRARDCRLFFFCEGTGGIVIEGRRYELRPGVLVLLPAGTEYIWQPRDNLQFLTVNFDFTDNFSNARRSFHPQASERFEGVLEHVEISDAPCLARPVILQRAGFIENRVRELIFTYYQTLRYREESLSALMKSILISIADAAEAHDVTTVKKDDLVYDIIRYLQAHYREPINAARLSERFHFSMAYINRIFKEKTGDSVHHFLVKHRIKIAAELLSSCRYTVAEVADSCGFCDVYHFSKTFKRMIGRSPLSYRQEWVLSASEMSDTEEDL